MTSLDDEAELMASRLLTLAAQEESNREVEELQTRPGEEQSVGTLEESKLVNQSATNHQSCGRSRPSSFQLAGACGGYT